MVLDLRNITKYKVIGDGSEGKILELSDEYCLKLLKKEIVSIKEEKIRLMLGVSSMKARKDVAWPLEVVTDTQGKFVGYIMRKTPKGSCTLNDFFIRKLYQLNNRAIIQTSIELLKCVKAIHDNGFVIADFNPKNWIIIPNGGIVAVDVDNYQFRTKGGKCFKANVACSEYLDKSLQLLLSKYSTPEQFPEGSFNLRSDAFGISVLVFKLLMNSTHPYHGLGTGDIQMCIEYNICHDYSPYFGKGNPDDIKKDCPSINVLSENLQKFFYMMFWGNYDINGIEDRMISELISYEKELTKKCQCDHVTHHYLPIWNKCPWCEIHRVKSGINLHERKKKSSASNHGVSSNPVKSNANQSGSHGNANNAVVTNNTVNVSRNPTTSSSVTPRVRFVNTTGHMNKIKKDQNRYKWVMIVFFIVAAIEITFFAKGYITSYFASSIGGSDYVFLSGAAPYLMLVAGLAVAFFVSYLIYSFEFSNGPTVVLDLAAQAGAFYILLGVVSAFISIVSYVLIVVIVVAIIGAFISGL